MITTAFQPILQNTHEVVNQPPPLQNYSAYEADAALVEAVKREGASWAENQIRAFGEKTTRSEFLHLGHLANKYTPELKTHDRFGNRIDEVEYHPAWHELMKTGVEAEVHALPWNHRRPGAHVARAAKHYLLSQTEAGVGCPLTMTFAVVPALRAQPEIAAEWIPRVTSTAYDSRMIPSYEKMGCLMGMAMTEKQGGSDVRSNTTRAVPMSIGGAGQEYLLTGHKWFCSAPMCDAFLSLAQTDKGLSCFLVPRWLPDGSRNHFYIQRLKDKLGNRSNASSEIEYRNTYARMVGEEGRGVPTIIEMVNHTRLDCVIGSSALMRQALVQAIHHCKHRSAFGNTLIYQPLMQNVLADLALESEAATLAMARLAHVYDETEINSGRRPYARLATTVMKYWVCKRAPAMISEALECMGGAGYVEESIMPRLYREAPVNSVWEGSGNVMCLDVLRALREPDALSSFMQELDTARRNDPRYDRFLNTAHAMIDGHSTLEARARRIAEMLALLFQASLLIKHSPEYVSAAFCASRLGRECGEEYGTLNGDVDVQAIVKRAGAMML
ncbi:MAG: isovaleryl-CoA dehydrogenase [Candidatus Hydrogenedentes bacterium]|nr:isovaleryl-CoA dehydrogenase [Candidatus Hydrogenedentota bacterium]